MLWRSRNLLSRGRWIKGLRCRGCRGFRLGGFAGRDLGILNLQVVRCYYEMRGYELT
jgi:hypothetical protein